MFECLGAGGQCHHVPSGIGVADASKVGGAVAAGAKGDVNHGVKGTEVTLRDGKYEGVVYAFDGLGVGGADADHRFVAFGVAAWVGRVI